MTDVELINCPYDSGRKGWRCGAGPGRILSEDLDATLRPAGSRISTSDIEPSSGYPCETSLGFDAQRRISVAARAAKQSGRLPIVLGGNCNTAVGGASGVNNGRLGIIWFDAHGDFCTPETTETGFFDGMGLAMLAGRCWSGMLSTVPGYQPIAEEAMALIGARSLSEIETRELDQSGLSRVSVARIRSAGVEQIIDEALERMGSLADQIYVHIDLDALDPEHAPANGYNEPDGLFPDELCDAVTAIGRRIPIAGAGFASYNPEFDPHGKASAVAASLIRILAEAAQGAR